MKKTAILLLVLALSGCVSRAEYSALAHKYKGFVENVGPKYKAYVQSDSKLDPQSKKNRCDNVDDNAEAAAAAVASVATGS